jgi:hypothetical protein
VDMYVCMYIGREPRTLDCKTNKKISNLFLKGYRIRDGEMVVVAWLAQALCSDTCNYKCDTVKGQILKVVRRHSEASVTILIKNGALKIRCEIRVEFNEQFTLPNSL